MARKMSWDALNVACQQADAREYALRDFVRALAPPSGWHFVAGPRDVRASLLFVDDEHVVIYHVADLGSEERRALGRVLYDGATEGPFFDSLMRALDAWRAWLSRVYPHLLRGEHG